MLEFGEDLLGALLKMSKKCFKLYSAHSDPLHCSLESWFEIFVLHLLSWYVKTPCKNSLQKHCQVYALNIIKPLSWKLWRPVRGTQRIVSVNYLFWRPLIPSDFLKRIVTSNYRDIRNLMSVVFGLLKLSFWVPKKGQLSFSERR